MGVCLLAPSCFGLGSKVIGQYDMLNKDLRWSELNQPATFTDEFTLSTAFFMLIFGMSCPK